MTQRTDLTTSWQMISDADGVFATGSSTEGVQVGFSTSAPTGDDFHTFHGDFAVSATGAGKMWARVESGDGHICADGLTEAVAFGLLNVAPRISIGVF